MKKRPKTRARQAAERGISPRTLHDHIARERAEIQVGLERLSASALLLVDRANKISELLSPADAARLAGHRERIGAFATAILREMPKARS